MLTGQEEEEQKGRLLSFLLGDKVKMEGLICRGWERYSPQMHRPTLDRVANPLVFLLLEHKI
jgi:hypothetical protein